MLGMSTFKKTEIKDGAEIHRCNMFAYIVKNTSLTMRDIEDLRINQLEDLLLGISDNAEREQAELNGESTGRTPRKWRCYPGIAWWAIKKFLLHGDSRNWSWGSFN